MKRSHYVSLTLLASLVVVACDADQATQQALYATQQECVEDWGMEDECDDDGFGHWHGPHYYYHSGKPYYYSKKHGAVPVPDSARFSQVKPGASSSKALSTTATRVSRGGFGSSAKAFAASS